MAFDRTGQTQGTCAVHACSHRDFPRPEMAGAIYGLLYHARSKATSGATAYVLLVKLACSLGWLEGRGMENFRSREQPVPRVKM
ncbi:MAG: hypothetical protein IMW90_16565 [Thermogemmatispora sp.]|uniref:hypothetical protein n=1 Tax=Thermogemmatispora sp. TaxID=1968838 RepID=UPI001A0CB9B3|nr:hypothetical protein [Thermogemmatispora sp.]MBE3567331.1 hypothetical protein [Thermogemmatispora sp.]